MSERERERLWSRGEGKGRKDSEIKCVLCVWESQWVRERKRVSRGKENKITESKRCDEDQLIIKSCMTSANWKMKLQITKDRKKKETANKIERIRIVLS